MNGFCDVEAFLPNEGNYEAKNVCSELMRWMSLNWKEKDFGCRLQQKQSTINPSKTFFVIRKRKKWA